MCERSCDKACCNQVFPPGMGIGVPSMRVLADGYRNKSGNDQCLAVIGQENPICIPGTLCYDGAGNLVDANGQVVG